MGIFRHKLAQATKRLSFVIAVLVAMLLPTLTAIAAPGDYSWHKTPYQFQGDTMSWQSIASSADGTKLAAVASSGFIYTSTDSGATWTEQTAAGSRWWRSIAMSSDGMKLAAVASSGFIYTSTDSGTTWTQQTAAGSRYWRSIAMSSDGTRLAAGAAGSSIYTSTDSGATWTEQTGSGSRSWGSIAMSSDGTKLAAVADGGSIYTSTDSGATWTEQTGSGSRYWRSIAMSSDGSKLAAGVYYGFIYLAEQEGPATVVSVALPSIPSTNQAEAVADPVKGATLGITSSECYGLNSAGITTLSPSSVTAPANVTILGGIGYDVSCVANGGSADATVALNAHYPDIAKVRVYKTTATSNELVDVTDQVVIKNEVINGKMVTTISYTLQDGQDFDEDELANGTIVDPLYIGVEANTPASPAGGSLASTGTNILVAIAAAAGLVATAVIVLVVPRRRMGLSRS